MKVTEHSDYRIFLRSLLEKRLRSNAHYSLRAFAKSVQVSPQALSLVLSGKRGISLSTAAKISSALGLSEEEKAYFSDLVVYTQARSSAVKGIVSTRLKKASEDKNKDVRVLKDDTFRVISDWYHYAIVELTFIRGFKNQPRWIAHKLGISEFDVKSAIERLLRLGVLTLSKDGKLSKSDQVLTTPRDVPSDAIRKFHLQILDRAKHSLEFDPIFERDFTTTTMAINPSNLGKAKELVQDFHQRLSQLLEDGPRTSVFCLSIELFPLSKNLDNSVSENQVGRKL